MSGSEGPEGAVEREAQDDPGTEQPRGLLARWRKSREGLEERLRELV